jgi:cell wall assembly regulator SMI1
MLADMLRSLAGLQLTDEDGKVHLLELRPPATDAELRRLEETLPAPLPEGMRAVLAVSTGLAKGLLESFSLLDLEGFGLEEAFPQAYSIAQDGYGNYWVLDLLPGDGAWGPVFYACHDPAVIGYQAETIEAFLADIVAMWRPGRSRVDRMHEEEVHRIWREHPGLLTPDGAAGSDDPILAGFAATLPAASRRRSRRRHGSPIFAGHDSQTVSPGGASARGPRSGAPAGNVSGRSSRRSGSPDCCDASSEPEP